MADDRLIVCKRCAYYWRSAGSLYCTECLRTHPRWAPTKGCGDLGCYLNH